MEEEEIVQIKKFCLKHACNVFQSQKLFDDSTAETPLELAQWFFDWITDGNERNNDERLRRASCLGKVVTCDPDDPEKEERQE